MVCGVQLLRVNAAAAAGVAAALGVASGVLATGGGVAPTPLSAAFAMRAAPISPCTRAHTDTMTISLFINDKSAKRKV